MNLFYQCFGQPGLPVIVLLHGFLGSTGDWEPLIKALEQDHFLVALDLPGHGRSHWPVAESMTLESFAPMLEDTFIQIEKEQGVELKKLTLLGYSLGGRLAMSYASEYPGRIRQLILEGAHPGLVQHSERMDRYYSDRYWAERLLADPLADVLADWYRQPVFQDLEPEAVHRLIDLRSGQNGRHLASALLSFSLSVQPDYRTSLSNSCYPVHYFCGEKDQKFSRLGQALLQSGCIYGLHVIAESGHNIHQGRPDAMAARIRELTGVDYE